MYGSEKTDLLVKYYDLAFGISGEAEVAWYLDKARSYGGPVLDLACGTGRLALLLAQEGFEVTGVDASPGMLNQFRQKRNRQPQEFRRRVHIENQPMAAFELGGKFKSILCCDAFFHILSVEDQINCLRTIARHLEPEGGFLFNLPNPTCEFLLASAANQAKKYEERGRYPLVDGSGDLLVEQAQAGDLQEQTIATTLRFTRFDQHGKVVEKGDSSWKTRYLFRYEAVHLLYRCGFQVEALVGDYQGNPVSEGGQLIFEARLGGVVL